MVRLFLASLLLVSFFSLLFQAHPVQARNFGYGVSLDETLRDSGVNPDNISNLPRFNIETETSPVRAFESILLNYVIRPIFLLSGGVAVVMILYSSFLIITARGQEEGLTSAKNTLTWAFIGLGLIMLAYTIVSNLASIILEVL